MLAVVTAALAEDLGRAGDVTAQACIGADTRLSAVFAARQSGVVAGLACARLAVLTEAQGRHIGSRLLSDAERRIAQAGGTMAAVHSENDHYKFYEQRGYRLTDEVYEGGRHGWLVKDLILGSEN